MDDSIPTTKAMFFDEEDARDYTQEHGGIYREIYDGETIFCFVIDGINLSPVQIFLDDLNALHRDHPEIYPDIIGDACKDKADSLFVIYQDVIRHSDAPQKLLKAYRTECEELEQIAEKYAAAPVGSLCRESALIGTMLNRNLAVPF